MALNANSDRTSEETTNVYVHRDATADDAVSDFIFCTFDDDVVDALESPGAGSPREWVEAEVMREYDGEDDDLDELVPTESERVEADEPPTQVGTLQFNRETGEIVDLDLDPGAFDDPELVTDGGVDVEPDLLVEYDPRELDTFALVPCSATKNPGRLPARDKYAGSLSNKARDYAEAIADGYAILSGKYGALAPYREIDDYDVSVRDRDADRWGAEVVEDLDLSIDPYGLDRLVVLAGAAYREPLADWFAGLEDAGVTVEIPLEGLRIGEQMSELNDALEAIEDPREVVTDGGLPVDEDDVMVRRARLEPGRGEDDEDPELVTDGGETELPDEVNGWSLALEAGACVRYEGDLVTVEIFGSQGGFDLKYGSPNTFQSLTLEESIEDRERAIERLLALVEERTPEEAGEHIERLQSDEEDDESASEADVDADVEDFQPASELAADGGKDVGEALSELDVIRGRDEETVERRRVFIREVLEYLEEHGSASRSEIMDDLLPDEETSEERVGYAPLSAWKHLVRPSLSALAEDLDELGSPGERGQGGWSWTSTKVYPPEERVDPQLREQVEALETGDVIRVKGTVEGEEVETRELEIVEDSASGFKVRDGAETYGVEITPDGVVAWQTVYGGRIHVDEIELLDPGSLRDDVEPEESDEEPIDEDQRARELVVEEIVELLESDLSAAQALDYYMTEAYEGTYGGFSQSGWGEIRGTSHQAISDSVRKARKALGRD